MIFTYGFYHEKVVKSTNSQEISSPSSKTSSFALLLPIYPLRRKIQPVVSSRSFSLRPLREEM